MGFEPTGEAAARARAVTRRRLVLLAGCVVVAFAAAFGVGSAVKRTTTVRSVGRLASSVGRNVKPVTVAGIRAADVPRLHSAPRPPHTVTRTTATATKTTPVSQTTTSATSTPEPTTPTETTPPATTSTPAPTVAQTTTQVGGIGGG